MKKTLGTRMKKAQQTFYSASNRFFFIGSNSLDAKSVVLFLLFLIYSCSSRSFKKEGPFVMSSFIIRRLL